MAVDNAAPQVCSRWLIMSVHFARYVVEAAAAFPSLSLKLIADLGFVVVASQEIELTYARHDVFLSPYPLINEEALGYLRAFLTQASQIKIKL